MQSLFTWIDHSEKQRRKILDVIDLFHEQGTRDELGLSTIRDAIADLLFPGTGSLQTRARYFLFIPWMYLEFETKRISSADILRRSRQYEIKLINVLAESKDNDGTIGILARAALRRMASNIYWTGLGKLGIRNFAGSQDEYHRFFDRLQSMSSGSMRNDDGELVIETKPAWHSGIPAVPPEFPEKAEFALSPNEAEYLRERINCTHKSSLFAFLLNHLENKSNVDFAWLHERVLELPPALSNQLQHAKNFSEVMHGSAFLYNLMLAEQEPRREDLVTEYESAMEEWAITVESQMRNLRNWDRNTLWDFIHESDPTNRPLTERFVNGWIDLVLSSTKPRDLKASPVARALIQERERQLKRSLARLFNPRARELWRGAAGTAQLDYRWRNAQLLLNDIFAGLQGGNNA